MWNVTDMKENETALQAKDQWHTYSFLTHQSDYLSYTGVLVKRR